MANKQKTAKSIIKDPVTKNPTLQLLSNFNFYAGTLKAVAIFTLDVPSSTFLNQVYTPFKKEFPNITFPAVNLSLIANEHTPFVFL